MPKALATSLFVTPNLHQSHQRQWWKAHLCRQIAGISNSPSSRNMRHHGKNIWSKSTLALQPDASHLKSPFGKAKGNSCTGRASTLSIRRLSSAVLCSAHGVGAGGQGRGEDADSAFSQTESASAPWGHIELARHAFHKETWPDALEQCLAAALRKYYTCSYPHFIVLIQLYIGQYTIVSSTTTINVYMGVTF